MNRITSRLIKVYDKMIFQILIQTKIFYIFVFVFFLREFVIFNAYDNEQRTSKIYPKTVLIEVVSINENQVAFKAPGMITLNLTIPTAESHKETYVV